MPDGNPHIEPQAPSPETPAGLHRAELDRLIAIGMKIAERLGEAADGPEAELSKVSLDFTRVARAVRQTVALEAMLADAAAVHAEAEKLRLADEREELEDRCPWLAWDMSEDQYHAHQEGLSRMSTGAHLVKRAIKAETPDRDAREALNLDFQERLADEPDLFAGDTPLEEIINAICADLGVTPDWNALPKKDWDGVELAVKVALKGRGGPTPGPPPAIPAKAGGMPDMSMLYGVRLSNSGGGPDP